MIEARSSRNETGMVGQREREREEEVPKVQPGLRRDATSHPRISE